MITDFHSHILPGIDDGSANVQESLEMLRMEAEQGIGTVIATPHFYARYDTPHTFLEKRMEAEQKLCQAMAEFPNLPKVLTGAEVYFFRGISESELLPLLTIADNNYILLEMPQSPWTETMYREIEAIHINHGITPVIAHIDRYVRPFRSAGILQRLSELPVLVQANANFFLHRHTRNMALRMLKNDRIHLLGSDCHNLQLRSPQLGPAVKMIEQKLSGNVLERIIRYQDKVLENK